MRFLRVLLLVEAVAFAVAALVHFGIASMGTSTRRRASRRA